MSGRMARELSEVDRGKVLSAVDGLLRAERETGIAPKELVRIIASHRRTSQTRPGTMVFTTLRSRGN